MMSLNGNIFHITGHLWGEPTSHLWISFTPQQAVEQTVEMLLIWDAIVLIMTSL